MPSHLSDIGFRAENADDFKRLAFQAYDQGERLTADGGTYVRWSLAEGAELWIQLDVSDDVVGMNPHFSGESRMRVGLVDRFPYPENAILDGSFYAWAGPVENNPESGAYPFVFDAPDYLLHEGVAVPSIVEIQRTAFAHELQTYESDEAFSQSQTAELKFASESFIPSGLFTPEGESTEPPQAQAILTGHVQKAALLRNSVTGISFWWAHVRTLGGEIDVVADPLLLNGPIVPGGVISGSFWLSGRLEP